MIYVQVASVIAGICLYGFIAGALFPSFKKWDHVTPELWTAIWPIALLVGGPAKLGRRWSERRQGARALQTELDEVRRKKDEQDISDTFKRNYR